QRARPRFGPRRPGRRPAGARVAGGEARRPRKTHPDRGARPDRGRPRHGRRAGLAALAAPPAAGVRQAPGLQARRAVALAALRERARARGRLRGRRAVRALRPAAVEPRACERDRLSGRLRRRRRRRGVELRLRRRRRAGGARPPRLSGGPRPAEHGRCGLSAVFELLPDPRRSRADPVPLSPRLVWSLTGAATRQLLWGMPGVAGEVRRWRRRAAAIPDGPLRGDALAALLAKRASIEGAALFSTLARRRSRPLLQLLVAYEVMADFLDNVNERSAHIGLDNGLQLHLALCAALDPGVPASDYSRHHPGASDGAYLATLREACRERCARLPSYGRIGPLVRDAASMTQVLGLNHERDLGLRDRALEQWALRRFREPAELAWFELTAAASA